ncbi:hypothetical protein [Serratia nematodiphila]|uniref:hypothetical protein n=1 Tax=Serratia nematodiphila TaxID=458197 RepID=UPI0012BA31E7|nr:hypothetical protein [Serratia nematodiphila]
MSFIDFLTRAVGMNVALLSECGGFITSQALHPAVYKGNGKVQLILLVVSATFESGKCDAG